MPPVLIACLSCGCVHGYSWRCPETAAKTARVFRVGKANTLLLTPNDWSALSTGTVDGELTRLRRSRPRRRQRRRSAARSRTLRSAYRGNAQKPLSCPPPIVGPMRFKVHLQKDEDGWYVATVPSLPGCISQGRTPAAARGNVREAIALHLRALAEDGIPIRKPRGVIETTVAVKA
jgi:predicted RNase H-like HicB family nuclease